MRKDVTASFFFSKYTTTALGAKVFKFGQDASGTPAVSYYSLSFIMKSANMKALHCPLVLLHVICTVMSLCRDEVQLMTGSSSFDVQLQEMFKLAELAFECSHLGSYITAATLQESFHGLEKDDGPLEDTQEFRSRLEKKMGECGKLSLSSPNLWADHVQLKH